MTSLRRIPSNAQNDVPQVDRKLLRVCVQTFEGRAAPQHLLADALGSVADFSVILVSDVSRVGRSQDADQSAHYVYLCRRAGVAIEYGAEQFTNDGGLFASVVKGIKRAMAGEYSRELSTKVFNAHAHLARLG
jgi:hypothetical protein